MLQKAKVARIFTRVILGNVTYTFISTKSSAYQYREAAGGSGTWSTCLGNQVGLQGKPPWRPGQRHKPDERWKWSGSVFNNALVQCTSDVLHIPNYVGRHRYGLVLSCRNL
jgi:hypothetical protein